MLDRRNPICWGFPVNGCFILFAGTSNRIPQPVTGLVCQGKRWSTKDTKTPEVFLFQNPTRVRGKKSMTQVAKHARLTSKLSHFPTRRFKVATALGVLPGNHLG